MARQVGPEAGQYRVFGETVFIGTFRGPLLGAPMYTYIYIYTHLYTYTYITKHLIYRIYIYIYMMYPQSLGDDVWS